MMNLPTNDDDLNAAKVVGTRFRTARDAAGLSRTDVERRSGVSAKAIEKFEAGVQHPSYLRFGALCSAVGKSVEEILNGSDPEADYDEEPSMRGPIPAIVADPVADLLSELDELRADGFENAQRRGMAIVDQLTHELHFLEPGELISIARKRGVDMATCPKALDLQTAIAQNSTKGQEACATVEQRIVDTALVGADLASVDRDALIKVADQLKQQFNLEAGFFGWGETAALVEMLRQPLRQLAFAGQSIDLSRTKAAPARS